MAKMMCPKCKSFNIQVIVMKRKGFSIGKMVTGLEVLEIASFFVETFILSKKGIALCCIMLYY